ncbi:MAG: hypothetical protein HQ567_16110 [Candidatus Nealsonbacteria bacterium]|nr:hypothetical protein [Candidatus Nealsonbacteria bacterium]
MPRSHLSRIVPPTLAVAVVSLILVAAVTRAGYAAGPSGQSDFFQKKELGPDVALSGKQFYIPTVFGPTGMNGWMLGETLVVREVENGSPADGLVLTNDVISSVNGKPLGAEPLKAFGQQVEPSEQTGKMELLLTRAGKQKKITLPIRKLGSLSEDWPFDCAKSRAIHLDACEYLARIQNHDGLFDGKIYVGFALNGLIWLASEDPKYMENARRLAYGYRKDFDPEAVSTINWEWAYMGVFLTEYYLQTGDETVLPLCQEIGQSLAQSQQPTGTWGHGSYPGLSYVQGGSLNNCGLVCWLALVLMDEAGVPVDQRALAKATHFFSRFTHRGGVPYGDHRPEFGGGNGKNAIPGVVLNILGDQAGSEYYARLVTGSYRGRTGGHTGGFMGFIWGNIQGARNPHAPDYCRMLDHWQWLLDVSRRWDGGFLLPESVIGKIYTYRGPVLSTGGVAQLYAMPNRVLRIHGGPKSVFAAQELPVDLEKGIELYRSRRFDELRAVVKPNSEHARQLLAAADRQEKDLELSFAKLESAIARLDFTLARRVWTDLDRFTRGEHPRRGSYNWRINTTEGAADVAAAEKLYRRHKWLTYTSPAAREAFERMATDPKAGVYQKLARRELATPDDSPLWAFFCELLWKEDAVGWQIDDQARAAALRVADMPSGNWPKIAALNDLYAAGILTERLKKWTPLVPANTPGYSGEKLTWRMLSVPRAEGPPADWTTVDFDDSEWDAGNGPLVSGKETAGMRVQGGGTPFIRIAFDCERTDYDALVLVLRLLKATQAVAYLNGEPILWSDALQGPRMHIVALATIPLERQVVGHLRKGRNVLAVRVSGGNGADFGLYASTGGNTLAFQPRPKDWAPGPVIGQPDLSTKTPGRPQLETVLAPNTTGLTIDPPGKPNVSLTWAHENFLGAGDQPPLAATPIAERAQYFGHIDSRIRRTAAYSLMAEGAKAMPHILDALDSKDIRVIRAGCDALAGSFGMNGLGKGNYRKVMTSDIAGQAVPKLLPLLKHEDLYVREGALLALSNCGKAAAKHLDKIILAADDEDWWVRAGVSHVLTYVEEPETQGMAASTISNFLKEESTFGRNRLRQSLVAMARRGHNVDVIVEALMIEATDEHGFYKGMARSALSEIGANAKAAAPLFEEQLKEARDRLAGAETDAQKTQLQRTVDSLESTLRKMNPAAYPEPPRPPKKRK